jgi:hypothetical protein
LTSDKGQTINMWEVKYILYSILWSRCTFFQLNFKKKKKNLQWDKVWHGMPIKSWRNRTCVMDGMAPSHIWNMGWKYALVETWLTFCTICILCLGFFASWISCSH